MESAIPVDRMHLRMFQAHDKIWGAIFPCQIECRGIKLDIIDVIDAVVFDGLLQASNACTYKQDIPGAWVLDHGEMNAPFLCPLVRDSACNHPMLEEAVFPVHPGEGDPAIYGIFACKEFEILPLQGIYQKVNR